MKNYIAYFLMSGLLLTNAACNDEWEDEIYYQNIALIHSFPTTLFRSIGRASCRERV